jgi:signal transduction histidine kinase/DNA-binding NarL/FixJ family response regulator
LADRGHVAAEVTAVPPETTKILLVEDNPADARLIREMLAEIRDHNFEIDWVTSLSQAVASLAGGGIDLVILDLGLPDSQGLDTFIRAYQHGSHLPFLVLTGLADEALGVTAIRLGAQDYLAKGEVTSSLLDRAMRYAIERKRTETALEAERKKHFSLLNHLPAVIHLKDADFKIIFANRLFREIFGDPGDQPCYEVIYGRNAPCENCGALEVLKTGVAKKLESHEPVKGRIFEYYNYPFCPSDGPRLVLTLGIDITERKRAEEEIKERENQLTTIYENAPLVMMLLDSDRRVRKANKLAAQFVGAAATDLLGRRGGEALRCLHALDDPQGCGFGPHCQHCAVRLTVIETFETGRSHRQVEASLPFSIQGHVQKLTFLLCTARLSVQGQPQVLVTIQDITQRKQAERKLRESEENLRFLAYQLLSAQEGERRRISNELHDELGHALLTLKLSLRAIEKSLHPDQQTVSEELESLLHYIDGVVENVRRLYLDLTPGDIEDLGLTTALHTLIDEFASTSQTIQWSVNLINIDHQFSLQGQTAIYRIFQEILTNIGKHANPSQVSVRVREKEKQVLFEIEDDGCGFSSEQANQYPKKGMGLLAMEERVRMLGGTLKVWGQKDQGTKISFSIPISEGGQAD